MRISPTTPLIVTGPGGDYRTGWSESEIGTIFNARSACESLMIAAVWFLVGVAATLLFDNSRSPVKRPPASDVVRGVVDGAVPAAAPDSLLAGLTTGPSTGSGRVCARPDPHLFVAGEVQ